MQQLTPSSNGFRPTPITYQSCDVVQYLDLRQEEQISLKARTVQRVREAEVSEPLDPF